MILSKLLSGTKRWVLFYLNYLPYIWIFWKRLLPYFLCLKDYRMKNFISAQEIESMRRGGNYEKPLGGLERNRSYAINSSYLEYPPPCPLTSTAFFSFYLDPSSLLPTPFCLLQSLLPLFCLFWHYFTAFYQLEPWIKPSSGKNLITFKIYKGFGGRQDGYNGIRIRKLNSIFISATWSYITLGK